MKQILFFSMLIASFAVTISTFGQGTKVFNGTLVGNSSGLNDTVIDANGKSMKATIAGGGKVCVQVEATKLASGGGTVSAYAVLRATINPTTTKLYWPVPAVKTDTVKFTDISTTQGGGWVIDYNFNSLEVLIVSTGTQKFIAKAYWTKLEAIKPQ